MDVVSHAPTAPKRLGERLPTGNRLTVVAGLALFVVAAAFIRFGLSAHALLGAFLCAVLVLVSAIDLEHRVLPDAIVLPSVPVALALAAFWRPDKVLVHLLAGAAYGGAFLLISLVSPRGMGRGDVKLALLIGIALGSAVLEAAVISGLVLWVGAAVFLFRHGLAARKQTIPFGPYLAVGAIVAFLFA